MTKIYQNLGTLQAFLRGTNAEALDHQTFKSKYGHLGYTIDPEYIYLVRTRQGFIGVKRYKSTERFMVVFRFAQRWSKRK